MDDELLQWNELVASTTAQFFTWQPTFSTLVGLPAQLSDPSLQRNIEDYSPAGSRLFREFCQHTSQQLRPFCHASEPVISRQAEVLVAIFDFYAGAAGIDYGYIDGELGHLPYIINCINGPLIDVPKIMEHQQIIDSPASAEDYLARLAQLGPMVYQVLSKFKTDAQCGVCPPRAVLAATINVVKEFINCPPADHPLCGIIEDRLSAVNIDSTLMSSYCQRAQRLLEEQIYPAYQAVVQQLPRYLAQAPVNPGITHQPGGDIFYQYQLNALAPDVTAEQLLYEGEQEVARIQRQLTHLLSAYQPRLQGAKTVGEKLQRLAQLPELQYASTATGKRQLLTDLAGYVDKAERACKQWFEDQPQTLLEIKVIPDASAANESMAIYTPPPLAGEGAGTFWINLRDMAALPQFTLKTLAFHETIPGHHFQLSLAQMQTHLPYLQRVAPFTPYIEGWALYAEALAAEMGLYNDDCSGNIGRLQDELFRAARLVVDTGIHSRGWSRQQAIDYLVKTTGRALSELVPEVDRYSCWPGQALAYKFGMSKILKLREYAQHYLAEQFEIKAFHQWVLSGGAVPFVLLEQDIERWCRAYMKSHYLNK